MDDLTTCLQVYFLNIALSDQETPCELQYLGVPLLSPEICRKSELGQTYKTFIQRDLPDIQLCAGHLEGGKDACQVRWTALFFHTFSSI
jgi:hypothetical protein